MDMVRWTWWDFLRVPAVSVQGRESGARASEVRDVRASGPVGARTTLVAPAAWRAVIASRAWSGALATLSWRTQAAGMVWANCRASAQAARCSRSRAANGRGSMWAAQSG
ncbi:hypothetical protein GCM10022420_047720 [Streptomyces iranensis]